ncbi:MAG TPA: hypothetical protein VGC28_09030, partial [Sphingomonas sp.]
MTGVADAQAAPFSPRAVLIIVAAAVLALAAFGLLLAFGDDLRSGHDARAHALSISADGYAGLVELVDDIGAHSLLIRDPHRLATRALLIVTPEPGLDRDALPKLLAARNGAPTLIVLPKWSTAMLPANRAWTQTNGLLPPGLVGAMLGRVAPGLRVTQCACAAPVMPPPDVPRLMRRQGGAERQRIAGP